MHHDVVEYLNSEDNANRFAPVVVCNSLLPDLVIDQSDCGDYGVARHCLVKAACRAYAVYQVAVVGAQYVSTIGPLSCVFCWSFYSTVWVALGRLTSQTTGSSFQLLMPLQVLPLMEALADEAVAEALDAIEAGLSGHPDLNKKRRCRKHPLVLKQIPSQWTSPLAAECDLKSAQVFELKVATKRAKKGEPSGPQALANADEIGELAGGNAALDDELDDGILGKMIAEVMDAKLGVDLQAPEEIDNTQSESESENEKTSEGADVLPPTLINSHPMFQATLETQHMIARSVADLMQTHAHLIEAAREQAEQVSSTFGPKDVSLIVKEGQVFYFWWDDCVSFGSAGTHLGWRIRLDKLNRIIYTVPYKKSRELLCNASVIAGRLPVTVLKEKGRLRPDMPPWVVLWQIYHQARYYSGPLEVDRPHRHALTDMSDECVLCCACASHGIGGIADDAGWRADIFVCKVCCSLWHYTCACLFQADEVSESSRVFKMRDYSYAFDPDAFTCPLCWQSDWVAKEKHIDRHTPMPEVQAL